MCANDCPGSEPDGCDGNIGGDEDRHRHCAHDFDIFFPAPWDALGNLVPLTGATGWCSAQTGNDPPIAADAFFVDDGPNGLCHFRFRTGTTATFKPGQVYEYDGLVRLSDGSLHTIGAGSFKTREPVTPTPS